MVLKKEEKEKRVIELHEQGKTYREIAKEEHLSPGRISSIIKKSNGEDETKPVSKDRPRVVSIGMHGCGGSRAIRRLLPEQDAS